MVSRYRCFKLLRKAEQQKPDNRDGSAPHRHDARGDEQKQDKSQTEAQPAWEILRKIKTQDLEDSNMAYTPCNQQTMTDTGHQPRGLFMAWMDPPTLFCTPKNGITK